MSLRVWWDMQLMLDTKNKQQERGTGSLMGGQRWNTFCQRLVVCQVGLASVLSLHSWGKPGPPAATGAWGVQELDSADLSLSVAAHYLGELGQVTLFF